MGETRLYAWLAIGLSALASCARKPQQRWVVDTTGPKSVLPAPELQLERALPIDGDGDFEPSGLLWFEGHLLTVSDKHNDAVFELELLADHAVAHVFRQLTLPSDAQGRLDFEGLTAGDDGELLLASEEHYRVLAVAPNGAARWRSDSLRAVGENVGMFRKHNAAFEGITRLADGSWLLCAERDPRGLMMVPATGASAGARAWLTEASDRSGKRRSPDFADLTNADGQIYVLERNAQRVVRLAPPSFYEVEAWSYAKTEDDPRFAYESSKYGRGEGLALDREHVYVVLDNNRDRRAYNGDDRRPLLFVFRRPATSPAGEH